MRVVYIAGKFRGPDAWAVARNVRAAETLAFEVWAMGAAALCPHTNTANFDGTLDAETWLTGTLELMRRCDAVLLVPGWRQSVGATGEVAEANRLGLPCFEDTASLGQWLHPGWD